VLTRLALITAPPSRQAHRFLSRVLENGHVEPAVDEVLGHLER
jgi:hypothetical protein